ncbi:integral membrane protein 2C [Nasonia vitripennis]|uniref:Integral membrane protein 2 n=1 Tax=Nasonia vitripennis TaxID=7425 RepID=A0A7M7PXK9_NASVI|nr:integral membrane protein 2C [Nasonia vitripennis]XP_031778593.1 integral membrane protein 2C [Nasonia vitripennis]XP_031778594.1 integral membrane protein 2C [Nasonia vitripennis]
MTVITKAIGEKKVKAADKLEQPLVVGLEVPTDEAQVDPESQHPKNDYVVRKRYLILSSNALRPSAMTTLCLFMTAIIVMSIGIIGGLCIYKLYARDQMHRFRTAWYSIPYDASNKAQYSMDEQLAMEFEKAIRPKNFFSEQFEIDVDNQIQKIDVPDFRGGRQGRFIHDFNINKTGIIDIDGHSCFVMPLNRQRVLPPRNMYDLLKKMYNGYYEVDTEIVRETMKVLVPPIDDLSVIGTYIARECQSMPTYLLQPVNDNVYKRSTSSGIYGQFAGKNIIEFDIINLDSVITKKK